MSECTAVAVSRAQLPADVEACKALLGSGIYPDDDGPACDLIARLGDGSDAAGAARVKMPGDASVAAVHVVRAPCAGCGLRVAARLLWEAEVWAWEAGATEVRVACGVFDDAFFDAHAYAAAEGGSFAKARPEPSQVGWFLRPAWVAALEGSWQHGIPVSDVMGIRVTRCTDWDFAAAAPLAANVNVHGTMFAGSVYSLATLAGWGATHMRFRETCLEGSIVLADASIKYRRPVRAAPSAVVEFAACNFDFNGVAGGGKASVSVPVAIYDGGALVGEFVGRFVVLGKREA